LPSHCRLREWAAGHSGGYHGGYGGADQLQTERVEWLYSEIPKKENRMKKILVIVVALFLFSCAAGPVHMAKTEQESIKNSYDEAQLKSLNDRNSPLLH